MEAPIDLGNAPSASQMPGRRLIEELEKRGLKASGFPDDDARRLQVLLEAGADINQEGGINNETPLHTTARLN